MAVALGFRPKAKAAEAALKEIQASVLPFLLVATTEAATS